MAGRRAVTCSHRSDHLALRVQPGARMGRGGRRRGGLGRRGRADDIGASANALGRARYMPPCRIRIDTRTAWRGRAVVKELFTCHSGGRERRERGLNRSPRRRGNLRTLARDRRELLSMSWIKGPRLKCLPADALKESNPPEHHPENRKTITLNRVLPIFRFPKECHGANSAVKNLPEVTNASTMERSAQCALARQSRHSPQSQSRP